MWPSATGRGLVGLEEGQKTDSHSKVQEWEGRVSVTFFLQSERG